MKLHDWVRADITWSFMKEKIVEQYCSSQYFLSKMNDFLNLRQGGMAVEVYQGKFLELFGYGPKLDEGQLISRFVQGLSDELRFQVDAGNPKTLAEAARMAGILESGLKKRSAPFANPRVNDHAKRPFVPNHVNRPPQFQNQPRQGGWNNGGA